MFRKYNIYGVVFVFLPLLISCSGEDKTFDRKLNVLTGHTMGTTYSVKVVDENQLPDQKITALKQSVDSILIEVNRQMSTYIPEAEISRFNKFDKTEWFNISEDFAFVLDESIQICKITGNSLDITIAPVVNIWGFGPDQRPRKIPTDDELLSNMKSVGIENLQVKFDPPAVKKSNSAVQVDLSSTAKGFGVDKVFYFLTELGYKNIMVEIGGEVRTSGYNHKNEFWKIGISEADQSGGINKVVELKNSAMATSGDYWNYFEEDGVRYSHTIDPLTGKPITHKLASVTVIDSTCLRADGLATGIFVMGPEKGYNFAVEMELMVYMIVKNDTGFGVVESPKFAELIEN
ncbi:MAG: FAD:protein FMN transferase [Melioribacteraceae bacterium]|nr:FAD:protein FMN transferase [Melioribacteraceae bacterium]MCF8355293.1 FAD:protein FMN transferase [Melioribacteraceae bacterium]MCF8394139.1 FAD:protein FMN transferase [Melioribacteraceae bacterium]MCF8418122.1 FAD:protein FMN transferase [Melioribacteraceae bacterium]